jgi:predicted phosphodiesterase
MKLSIKLFFVCLWLLITAANAASPKKDQSFSFALIGDAPYTETEEVEFVKLIDELNNQKNLEFVVHIGDIKSGSTPCEDRLFLNRKKQFDSFVHPLIYVPGDNDWLDCQRKGNGAYDPVERLNNLRKVFFEKKGTLGKKSFPLTHQSDDKNFKDYRENVRWVHKKILFVSANTPGGNNNYHQDTSLNSEYNARNKANLAWLTQAFDFAKSKRLSAIVIMAHADPGFELNKETQKRRGGYIEYLTLLEQKALEFGKPVLLLHGDSHIYRVNQPLIDQNTYKAIDNFTRVESFGSPTVNWVLLTVNPDDPKIFTVKPGR